MRQPTDINGNPNITTTHNQFKSNKLKILTINVIGLQTLIKEIKFLTP